MTKDCDREQYCFVCDSSKHSLSKCPVLKMPKPTTFVAGFGMEELMFAQFPDSLHQDQLAPSGSPTALVTVQGVPVLAEVVERQVARICPNQSWKWEAVANGANSFLLGFPSAEDLMRVDGLELGVPGQASKLIISQWTPEEIPPKMELTQVWVHVTGVPYPLRHFQIGRAHV